VSDVITTPAAPAPSEGNVPRENPRGTVAIRNAVSDMSFYEGPSEKWSKELAEGVDTTATDQPNPTDTPDATQSETKSDAPKPKPRREVFDAKGYSNQHAALSRRAKAIEAQAQAAEAKLQAAAEREARLAAREAELTELDSLDEFSTLQRIAEKRGSTVNDVVRAVLAKAAGYEASTPKSDLPPAVQAQLKEFEKTAKELREIQQRLDAKEAAERNAAQERAVAQERNWFANTVSGALNEREHPTLTALAEANAKYLGEAILETVNVNVANGWTFDADELLAHLEKEESARLKPVVAKLSKPSALATPSSPKRTTTPKYLSGDWEGTIGYTVGSERKRVADAVDYLKKLDKK